MTDLPNDPAGARLADQIAGIGASPPRSGSSPARWSGPTAQLQFLLLDPVRLRDLGRRHRVVGRIAGDHRPDQDRSCSTVYQCRHFVAGPAHVPADLRARGHHQPVRGQGDHRPGRHRVGDAVLYLIAPFSITTSLIFRGRNLQTVSGPSTSTC